MNIFRFGNQFTASETSENSHENNNDLHVPQNTWSMEVLCITIEFAAEFPIF